MQVTGLTGYKVTFKYTAVCWVLMPSNYLYFIIKSVYLWDTPAMQGPRAHPRNLIYIHRDIIQESPSVHRRDAVSSIEIQPRSTHPFPPRWQYSMHVPETSTSRRCFYLALRVTWKLTWRLVHNMHFLGFTNSFVWSTEKTLTLLVHPDQHVSVHSTHSHWKWQTNDYTYYDWRHTPTFTDWYPTQCN